jgi:hypothetical protein
MMNTKYFVDRRIRALLLTVALLAALLFLVAWTLPLADYGDATFLGRPASTGPASAWPWSAT